MGKGYTLLDAPRHAASVSIAYPQGRSWSARARSMAVQLLFSTLAVWMAVTAITAAGLYFKPHAPATKYVLVIDSGSSGQRMYAYTWSLPGAGHSRSGSGLPAVQAIPPSAAAHLVPKKAKKGLYNRVETQPGLDAFAGDSAGLRTTALEPLLAWARAVVPQQQHGVTPLFLLGTGGLRRMAPQAQAALMAETRKVLAASGFRFQDPWAKVISGTDEGMYGWLALNYGQGLLEQPATSPASATAALSRRSGAAPVSLSVLGVPDSLGTLDMGGSSLEMTFEVLPGSGSSGSSGSAAQAAAAAVPAAGLQNITVAGRTFHLHTHTFRHYGLNEAFDRSVTLLLQQQQRGKQVQEQRPVTAVEQQPVLSIAQSQQQLLQPDIEQQQQQEQERHAAPADQQKGSPQGQLGAPFATNQAAAPLDVSSGVSAAVLALHHAQVDLAVAAAAGVHPGMHPDGEPAAAAALLPGSGAPAAGAVEAHAPSYSLSSQDALLQHHIQADLAVAAAAGMHPKPLLELGTAASINTTSSSAGSTTSSSSSRSRQTGISAAAAAAATATAPAGVADHLRWVPLPQGDGSGAAAAPQPLGHRVQHRMLQQQHRDRRHQQRQQRQLLLQQHKYLEPDEIMDWVEGTSQHFTASVTSATSPSAVTLAQVSIQDSLTNDNRGGLPEQPGIVQHTVSSAVGQLRQLLGIGVAPGQHDSQSSPGHSAGMQPGVSAAAPGSAASPRSSSSSMPLSRPAASTPVDKPAPAAGQHSTPDAVSKGTAVLAEVWHPCLHDGYAAKYERLQYGAVLPQPAQVLLRGRPNWSACLALVDQVVDASAPCQVSSDRSAATVCRLGAAHPKMHGSFMALTGFYVVSKFLEVPSDAPLGALLDASKDLCARPWSWVSEHLGHNINVERYCTWGPYSVKLLRHGLRLEDKDVRVGSGDVGWPLGAALAEASKLPDMMSAKVAGVHHRYASGAASAPGGGGWHRQRSSATAASIRDGSSRNSGGIEPARDVKAGERPAAGGTGAPGADDGGPQGTAGVHGASDSDHHGGAWQYSQRRSWAQAIWDSRGHMNLGHVCAVLLCAVVWLSLVVYCLPNRSLLGAPGSVGLFPVPLAFRGLYGPGKAHGQHILPVTAYVGYSSKRNNPSPVRGNTIKYMGNL